MRADFPTPTDAGPGARPLLTLLEERLPGSRWDLLHWPATGPPSFLLGRLGDPHPGVARLDEEANAPPFLLEHAGGAWVEHQLSLPFREGRAPSRLDWIWPLGRRGLARQ